MRFLSVKLVRGLFFAAALLASPALVSVLMPAPALAETAEKDAFEAAKELGTVAAWNAFLANYPSGFHADLARAYLKKLGEDAQAAPPQASAPADNLPIAGGSWGGIVRSGPGQEYRKLTSLDEGDRVTVTERTSVMMGDYPWFKIEYANGKHGYQWGGILCAVGKEHPGILGLCPEKKAEPEATPQKTVRHCRRGYVRVDGKCLRKRSAVSYCGPGYRPEGGKCVLRQQQAPSRPRCPPGQVWSPQELCHYDD